MLHYLSVMDRIALKAQEREIVGKKVKTLRRDGLLPANIYGKKTDSEHVTVNGKEFIKVFNQAGETGLVNLKVGEDRAVPVMIRDIQVDPATGNMLHVDFYKVNLKEKVTVPVPIVLIGDEAESVHLGEAIVLQPISEVEVEALPTDLIDKIEVDITSLQQIDDAVTIGQLKYDRETLTILTSEDEVVVKLAPAVTAEMEALMEEQEAEAAAASEAVEDEEGMEAEEAKEGEGESTGGEESSEDKKEESEG